jgi:hypothetical protein
MVLPNDNDPDRPTNRCFPTALRPNRTAPDRHVPNQDAFPNIISFPIAPDNISLKFTLEDR